MTQFCYRNDIRLVNAGSFRIEIPLLPHLLLQT